MEVFKNHAVNNVAYDIILLTINNFRFEENKYKNKGKTKYYEARLFPAGIKKRFSIFRMREADNRLLVEY